MRDTLSRRSITHSTSITTNGYTPVSTCPQQSSTPTIFTQCRRKGVLDSLDIQTEPLLRERVNWGDDPEQSFDDFLAMWERASLERDWIPPVGDTSRSAGARMQQVIESHQGPHKHVALVTHGGIITDFVLNVLKNEELDKALPNLSKTKENNVFECSLTIVEYDPMSKQYDLKLLACIDHLADL